MQVQQIILKQVGPFGDATIALPPGERPDLADVYLVKHIGNIEQRHRFKTTPMDIEVTFEEVT